MTLLDIALNCVSRGWFIFPCWPKTKKPMTKHGWEDASNDSDVIFQWWAKTPDANVAIAGRQSGLAVTDVDYGIQDKASLDAWRERNGIPETYTIRTGRRPDFGVQLYFDGSVSDVQKFTLDGCSGQIKSAGGYFMAAGCIHPSGEKYEVLVAAPIAKLPDVIRNYRKPAAEVVNNVKVQKTAWDLPVQEGDNRTGFLMEQMGRLRNLGFGRDAMLARMIELNDDPEIIAVPVDMDRLEALADRCATLAIAEPEPELVLG